MDVIVDAYECRMAEAGEAICKIKEPSGELVILSGGKLGVFNAQNMGIAFLDPVTSIGGMGLFTGQPRSAMVKVVERSTLLVLKKVSFDRLMRQTSIMSRRGYAATSMGPCRSASWRATLNWKLFRRGFKSLRPHCRVCVRRRRNCGVEAEWEGRHVARL